MFFLCFYAVAFLTKTATFSNLPSALFNLNVLKCASKSLSWEFSCFFCTQSKSSNLPLTQQADLGITIVVLLYWSYCPLKKYWCLQLLTIVSKTWSIWEGISKERKVHYPSSSLLYSCAYFQDLEKGKWQKTRNFHYILVSRIKLWSVMYFSSLGGFTGMSSVTAQQNLVYLPEE